MRRKLGGGRWSDDLGPGAAVGPYRQHVAGEIVTGLARCRQIPQPSDMPELPEKHALEDKTINAAERAIWDGDAQQRHYGRTVIELGSVRRAAASLGVTDVRVYQVLGLTRAA